jgi:hypothetical protein
VGSFTLTVAFMIKTTRKSPTNRNWFVSLARVVATFCKVAATSEPATVQGDTSGWSVGKGGLTEDERSYLLQCQRLAQ